MPKNMTDIAKQRSNIYGLLSLIYRTEVTQTFIKHLKDPEFLSVLSDMGAVLEDDFFKRPEDELVEDLAVEYTRLFIGPEQHISPHESVHHERDDGDWGSFWGRSTVEVKKLIEAAGLEYNPDFTGIPDHISVEFEFMHRVTEEEAAARENNDSDKANYCLQIEKKFVNEHLSKWVPGFCDKVISHAELSFYREIAKVTKHFMEYEREELKGK